MFIFIFSYMSMYRVLQTKVGVQPETNQPGTSTNAKESVKYSHAGRNILKTLIIVSICFTLCWISAQTYYLLTNIGVLKLTFNHTFNFVSTFLIYINSCVNPFIYVIHYQQFRRGVGLLKRRIANRIGLWSEVSNDTTITTTTNISTTTGRVPRVTTTTEC